MPIIEIIFRQHVEVNDCIVEDGINTEVIGQVNMMREKGSQQVCRLEY